MRRLGSLLCLALAVPACAEPPVEWGEAVVLDGASSWGALALAEGGAAQLVAAERTPTAPSGACPESVRVARGDGDERFAVWWAVRADSSAALVAARSPDGGATWEASVPVDSLDRSHRGCARPGPSIAVDSATRYVHVAYWLEGPEGAGVFFSHSMEPTPLLFHAPVAVVYGERPSQTAIAAERSIVVVAYQDPNARASRIAIAVSRRDGHIFDHRLPALTPPADSAWAPRVALQGRRLAVAWRGGTRAPGAEGRPAAYLRSGTLR
jgi:hypothetical protein